MYQTQWKHPPYLYCRSTLRILNKAWYMSSSSANYTAIRKQHFSLYSPLWFMSSDHPTCALLERGGAVPLKLPKWVSWHSGINCDCSWQRGEGLYHRHYHRLPAAREATSFQMNYNSHTICLPRTAAPMPGDVIRGDPLTQGQVLQSFCKISFHCMAYARIALILVHKSWSFSALWEKTKRNVCQGDTFSSCWLTPSRG